MKLRIFNKRVFSLLLTAILVVLCLPLQAHASSLLRLEGTDCTFTYPGVGDTIKLTNVSELNKSDRFCTLEANIPYENAVVYGKTTITLLKSGLLYANLWNGNRSGWGNQIQKTLWANNAVNEPSSKNIGSTLTLSQPGHYQIPVSVGGDTYTFNVEVRASAPDYASYLQSLVAKYGILPQFKNNSFPMCDSSVAKGVFHAELADFDGNGTQELLILYYKGYNSENDFDDLGIVYEVWSQDGSGLKMLYSNEDDRGLPFRMSESGALASIGVILAGGKQDLHVRTSGRALNYDSLTDELFTIIDGKWQIKHTLKVEATYNDDGVAEKTSYTVDGSPITEAEYLRAFTNITRGETLLITSLDNDYNLHISVENYREKLDAFIRSLTVTKTAKPSTASVLVDGKTIKFQAYEIENNNYFKLRDVAAAISGTKRQFNVEWDSALNSIKLISGNAYTKVGGELTTTGNSQGGQVPRSSSSILLDGNAVSPTAYTIASNNYFKLRDLGQLMHFDVRWDSASGTIIIDTTQDYTVE